MPLTPCFECNVCLSNQVEDFMMELSKHVLPTVKPIAFLESKFLITVKNSRYVPGRDRAVPCLDCHASCHAVTVTLHAVP